MADPDTGHPVRPREGLILYRWTMIVGSFAPLFILFGVRGTPSIAAPGGKTAPLIPPGVFEWSCTLLIAIPALVILYRIWQAHKIKDKRTIHAGQVKDSRENLLIYLFALLLPLYQNTYTGMRDVWAAVVLMVFIFFTLYHMNLHYLNLMFALLGYRVYTINPTDNNNTFNGQVAVVVYSRRTAILPGSDLQLYRISDTVYIE